MGNLAHQIMLAIINFNTSWSTVQYCMVLNFTVLYCATLFCALVYWIVLNYVTLYCPAISIIFIIYCYCCVIITPTGVCLFIFRFGFFNLV